MVHPGLFLELPTLTNAACYKMMSKLRKLPNMCVKMIICNVRSTSNPMDKLIYKLILFIAVYSYCNPCP